MRHYTKAQASRKAKRMKEKNEAIWKSLHSFGNFCEYFEKIIYAKILLF